MSRAPGRKPLREGPDASRGSRDESLSWLDVFKDAWAGVTDAAALPFGALALMRVPRSDGHAVLVLPGFLSSDAPTWMLRTYLAQIGYRVFPWELGFNTGFSHAYAHDIEALVEHRLKEVFIESGDRKISLVGWSLGGTYAKALARRYPRLIRDVITLGSPLSGESRKVSIWRLYEWVTGMRFSDPKFAAKLRELNKPLTGVPITAFFCKKDGVVPWRNACETPGPLVQNIEVKASHVGMGFDAFVYFLIGHRLAESSGRAWQPLDIAGLWRAFQQQRLPV